LRINNFKITKLANQLTTNKSMVFLDQALFAFFNFCTIIFLSKIAGIKDFSSFVLFQSNIFFVYVLCTFFLSSPILVLHTKRWNKRSGYYLRTLIFTNLLINLLLSIALFFFLRQQGVYAEYWYVLFIPLMMSLFDILRKYLLSSLKIKLVHSAISAFFLNLTFFTAIYFSSKELTLSAILFIYLISFVAGNLYLFIVIFIAREKLFFQKKGIRNGKKTGHTILNNHFKYSKWIILGGIAFWGYNQGIYIFSSQLGVEDITISKIRTIQNLLGVTNILLVSVENFYTPMFSKFITENSKEKLHILIKHLYLTNYSKLAAIAIGAFVFSYLVYDFLYFEKYGSGLWIIIFFTVSQILLLAIRPLIISLKSIELTRPFFYAHSIAVAIMLLTGYFLISTNHFTGMATAFVLSNATFSAVVIYFYSLKIMQHKN
tara:strand:- start:134376 stop:135668 length:1293 start_codon:yes stop_codon:yes gene_type:complete